MSPDFNWRVEEACLNAWPASRTVMLQGWLLRASGGPTRRVNSLNPTPGGGSDPRPVLAEAAALYTSLGQPLIARVPDLAASMDAYLDAAGFGPPQAETTTLHAIFGVEDAMPSGGVEVSATPSPAWRSARAVLNEADEAATAVYERMLSLILGPCLFAACHADDDLKQPVVSIAYGVISQGLLVLESVATAPAYRGRGLAARTVAALMREGKSRGAESACLQVMSNNASAIKVYHRLGFTQELYRYHYRTANSR